MFCGKCGKDMGDAVSFCPHCGAPIKNNGKGEKNMKDKTYNIKDVNGNKNGHHRSPVGKWIAAIIAVVVISAAAMLLNQRKTDHPQKGTETAESKESSETVQSTEAAETEQTKDVLMSYFPNSYNYYLKMISPFAVSGNLDFFRERERAKGYER